jgi:hypothetical protein
MEAAVSPVGVERLVARELTGDLGVSRSGVRELPDELGGDAAQPPSQRPTLDVQP